MTALRTLVGDARALAVLAVPLILTQLAQVALTTTDTVMMGLLGTEELAAGGLAIVIFNQLRTMGVGLITSVGNQVASAAARAERDGTGAGRDAEAGTPAPDAEATRRAHDEVRGIVRAAMAVATGAGVVGAALMIGIGQALPLLGQGHGVADRAQQMLFALAPGLLPCLWFQAVRQFTVGMRRPQALLRITVVSVAANAGLNWVLIHGTWIFPEMGLVGIGAATSTVYLLTFFALYAAARRDAELGPLLALNPLAADRATVRRLLGLGVPIAATYGSEAGFFSLTALLAGSFGTAALAAHTAVNQLVYIVFQVAVGLSHAASIHVSREIALGELGRARRLMRTALGCAVVVMTVVGTLYLALPRLVLAPFLDSSTDDAVTIGTHLLVVAAVLQLFDCAQNIGVGLLRGLDDTRTGFRMTLIGYWAVGLPASALLAFGFGWDTVGLWLGLLVGLAATAALLLRAFTAGLDRRAVEATAAA